MWINAIKSNLWDVMLFAAKININVIYVTIVMLRFRWKFHDLDVENVFFYKDDSRLVLESIES